MRIASLVGKTISGNIIQLGAETETNKITELITKFREMKKDILVGPVNKQRTLTLTELRLLANHTAGGELKHCRKFK